MEKLAIVRESMAPGASAARVARRHQVSPNVLYYWRKVYRDLLDADPAARLAPTEYREPIHS
jgi:transposase-like protein